MSSLYANIDRKNAIIALDPLLWEGKVTQTALLVQLTRLVFEINFLNKNLAREHHIVCKKFENRAPVAQLIERRAVMREVMSSTLAGPSLRVLK